MAKKGKAPEAMKVISEPDFKRLRASVKNRRMAMDTERGRLGDLIKRAVEEQHADKRALSIFFRLDNLSDEQLAVTLPHLEHYCEIGGLTDRIARQSKMFDDPKLAAEAAEEIAAAARARKKGNGKVVPISSKRKPRGKTKKPSQIDLEEVIPSGAA